MRKLALPVPLLAAALVASAALGAVPARAASASVRAEAADFAETAYGQPWDFTSPGQVAFGSTVTSIATSASGLSFTAAKGQQLSLVHTEANALPWGRDGSALPVDASRYTHLSALVYSDIATTAQIWWFNCPIMQNSCEGGTSFPLTPGWQTVNMPLADAYANAGLPAAWSGPIVRMILTPNASDPSGAAAHMRVAWLRLYAPSGAGDYAVHGVPAGASSVTWSRSGTGESGVLPVSGGSAAFPADAYPPGTYQFAAGGTTVDALQIDARPLLSWGSPNADGCIEYGTNVRHNPWDFTTSADVAKILDATNISFGAGGLAATNAPPVQNDPEVWLAMGPPLDAHRFYRVRLRISYDGPFGLANAPGGGMVARVFWGTAQYNTSSTWQASRPIVIYPGQVNDILLDMSTPLAGTSDPAATESVRYSWTQAGAITFLRIDPNEDPGQRRWYIESFQVFGNCTASGTFGVQVSDGAPGAHGAEQVAVYADTGTAAAGGAGGVPVASGVIPAGTGTGVTLTANLSGLATGPYRLYAVVTNGSASSGSYAPTPLDVIASVPVRSTAHSCPAGQVPADGFTDVPSTNVHAADIACVDWWQVAFGETAGTFAPSATVTRGQMASFIARMITRDGGSLPANAPNPFPDNTGPHAADVAALAAAGVVKGEPDGLYHPAAPVPRDQMATFLARAYAYRTGAPLPAGQPVFTDTGTDSHLADIDAIAAAGITGGTGGGAYSPTLPVPRDQMASFLARTLDLLVADGFGAPPGG